MLNSAGSYQNSLSQRTHTVDSMGSSSFTIREEQHESKEQKQELSEEEIRKRADRLYQQLMSPQEIIIDDILGDEYHLPKELTHLIAEYTPWKTTSHEDAVKIMENEPLTVVEALLKKIYSSPVYLSLWELLQPLLCQWKEYPERGFTKPPLRNFWHLSFIGQDSIDIFRNLPTLLLAYVKPYIESDTKRQLIVPLIYADLRPTDFLPIKLKGANLQQADLRGANLQGADLEGTDLQRANLQQANLQGVNLQWANLQGAHLQGADLQRVNLEGANLQGAKLRGADLERVDLNTANTGGTIFEGHKEYSPYCTGNSSRTLLDLLSNTYAKPWWFTWKSYRKEVNKFLAKRMFYSYDVNDLIQKLLGIIQKTKSGSSPDKWLKPGSALYNILKFSLSYDPNIENPDVCFEELLNGSCQTQNVNPSSSSSNSDHTKPGVSSGSASCSFFASSTSSASSGAAGAALSSSSSSYPSPS